MEEVDVTKPTTLYTDWAFAWAITGITVIRARTLAEATAKFDRISRATMLNRATNAKFHAEAIGEKEGIIRCTLN